MSRLSDARLAVNIVGTSVAGLATAAVGARTTATALVSRAERLIDRWTEEHPHTAGPDDGCCGCGEKPADLLVQVADDDPHHRFAPFGETYCWPCVDAGKVTIVDTDTVTMFPGHERWERS